MRAATPLARLLGFMLLLLSSFGIVAAPASFSGFNAKVWQVEDGLPHNVVQAVTQTRDGYLWVGTRQGLTRFDGVSFAPIILTAGRGAAPSVTSLAAEADGGLWIGTARDGLFRWKAGTISHYAVSDGSNAQEIAQILMDGPSGLWIATRLGLAHWQDGRVRFLTETNVARTTILSLCHDRNGSLWVGGARGVQRLDEDPLNIRVINGRAVRAIRALFGDATGKVWIGGGDGLRTFKDGEIDFYPKGEGPPAIVSALLVDHAGNVWVGTQGGLSRFVDGKFIEEPQQGATGNAIHALFEDREGSLWIGTAEGLVRLTKKTFLTYTRQHGLTQNAISSVCADRDGSIWIGTWGGGLDQLKNGLITAYNKSNGLGSDFVVGLDQTRDGTLWVGLAFAHGLGVDRLTNGRIMPGRPVTELVGPPVTCLLEDQMGTMWVGSRNGLGRFQNGILVPCAGLDDSTNINALCAGRDDSVWIGTQDGLFRSRNGQIEPSELTAFVLSLYEDPQGALWIGTMDEGLFRFSSGTFQSFSTRQGLPDGSIYSILEDRRHNLWLQSNKGLLRVAKSQFDDLKRGAIESLNCVAYGKADGILGSGEWQEATQQSQPAQPAACQGKDGRFWFRTSEGVAVVNPEKVHNNQLPPPVVIEQVVADRKEIQLEFSNPAATNSSTPTQIEAGHGDLEIHYTALSLWAPEKNRFRYRLEGGDPDWVDAGNRRVVNYSHLAPGLYTFRVVACNNDGIWNETGAVLGLKLQPHFWQTWWFMGSSGLLAAGLVGGGARYVTRRRIQQKLEHLRQLHAIEMERARIARDMHDELGAKLTRISFQGAIAIRSLSNPALAEQEIGKMTNTARALVSSLDEIVWAVDPENDSLENLAGYICRYAGDFFQNSPMTCEFFIPANLPDYRLPSDVRHNVFLAVKEALTNVLKHSEASQVQIRLTMGAEKFDIEVSDNGRGLNSAPPTLAPGRQGHGLINLRQRLELLHGSCVITSGPGGGTRVVFVIPLPGGPR